MPDTPGFLSLIPPLAAVATAILTREVFLSLFAGIWLGFLVLLGGHPLTALRETLEALVRVCADRGNMLIIIFSGLIGSLIALTQRSGGVEGLVRWITERGHVRSGRGAQLLAAFIGLGLFLESNLTCLVSGSIARPLFDRFRLSREKLAYICDATASPVCVLFPFNAYGALIVGLLAAQELETPLATMVTAIPFNFYAIFSIGLVFFIAASGWDWGPMARAERRAMETGQLSREGARTLVANEVLALPSKEGVAPRAVNMVAPILALLAMMPVGLWVTGEGALLEGDASTAIFWGMLLAVLVAGLLYRLQGIFDLHEIMDLVFRGFGGLVSVVFLIVLAFALGATSRELGTGVYLAGLVEGSTSPVLVPAALFLMSALASFSTGTSWGTFAIMLPIGVPMAETLGAHLPLTIGAVLGGGIFGDHCSPISDTTIVASLAAGSDHIDHVNTQLPYALAVAAFACLLYLVLAVTLR